MEVWMWLSVDGGRWIWRCVWFFVAGDGIRGAQVSRGLGGVYKSGVWCVVCVVCCALCVVCCVSVVYTHLTLPTSYSV